MEISSWLIWFTVKSSCAKIIHEFGKIIQNVSYLEEKTDRIH